MFVYEKTAIFLMQIKNISRKFSNGQSTDRPDYFWSLFSDFYNALIKTSLKYRFPGLSSYE